MSYNVQVNGKKGPYDQKEMDPSIRYGRNAVENHLSYMEVPITQNRSNPAPILNFSPTADADKENFSKLDKFIEENDRYLNSLPPLQYEYRYMPNIVNGNIDKKALLGAAYEEMGGVKELSVGEFERRYMNKEMTAQPMDVNKDGKIDIAEYGANILATDLLSKGTTDTSKVDGTINQKGMNAVLEYSKISNAKAAATMYAKLYEQYSLKDALNEINLP